MYRKRYAAEQSRVTYFLYINCYIKKNFVIKKNSNGILRLHKVFPYRGDARKTHAGFTSMLIAFLAFGFQRRNLEGRNTKTVK